MTQVKLETPVRMTTTVSFDDRLDAFLDDLERVEGSCRTLTLSLGRTTDPGRVMPALGINFDKEGGQVHAFTLPEIYLVVKAMESSLAITNLSEKNAHSISTLIVILRHGAGEAEKLFTELENDHG